MLYASDALEGSTTTLDTVSAIWRALQNIRHKSPYPRSSRLSVFIGVLTASTREGEFKDWVLSEVAYQKMLSRESQYAEDIAELPSELAQQNNNALITLLHNTITGVR